MHLTTTTVLFMLLGTLGRAATLDFSAFGASATPGDLGAYFSGGAGTDGNGNTVGPGPNWGVSAPGAGGLVFWDPSTQTDALGWGVHNSRSLAFAHGFTGLLVLDFGPGLTALYPLGYQSTIAAEDAAGNILASALLTLGTTPGYQSISFTVPGLADQLVFGANDGTDAAAFRYDLITFSPAAATTANPEPALLGLYGLGLLGFAALCTRVRKAL
jgi:hypothetical protein